MIATVAVVASVGTVIVAVAASIMAAELHACGPRFARWITRRAALWLPEDERPDYIDENDDHTNNYQAENLNVTAATQAAVSWASAVRHGGMAAWAWRDTTEQRLQGTIFGLSAGLIYGLSNGLVVGLVVGLIYGLGDGLSNGLVGGLVGGLVVGLVSGLVSGLSGGLIYGVGPVLAVKASQQLTLWLRGRAL